MPITVRPVAHNSAGYDQAVALRRAVLRTPLRLDFTAEQLAAEAADDHLTAWDGDRLVGTVVLTPYLANILKLRQMAVDPAAQGTGVGAALLNAAENLARAKGCTRLVLAARVTARGFYARYGYAVQGDEFEEVTLPHVTMTKTL